MIMITIERHFGNKVVNIIFGRKRKGKKKGEREREREKQSDLKS